MNETFLFFLIKNLETIEPKHIYGQQKFDSMEYARFLINIHIYGKSLHEYMLNHPVVDGSIFKKLIQVFRKPICLLVNERYGNVSYRYGTEPFLLDYDNLLKEDKLINLTSTIELGLRITNDPKAKAVHDTVSNYLLVLTTLNYIMITNNIPQVDMQYELIDEWLEPLSIRDKILSRSSTISHLIATKG